MATPDDLRLQAQRLTTAIHRVARASAQIEQQPQRQRTRRELLMALETLEQCLYECFLPFEPD